MTNGFDPLELPPDRFFNWLYRMFTKDKDEKELNKFKNELYLPLPWQEDVSSGPWSDEEMTASFMSAKTNLTGKKGG